MDKPLWQPSPARIANASLTAFAKAVREHWGVPGSDYDDLHQCPSPSLNISGARSGRSAA